MIFLNKNLLETKYVLKTNLVDLFLNEFILNFK